jgi:DNA invertase Pin-like site-specific DNA recombinase
MLIGYARVSTQDQNLDSQINALTKAGCNKVFQEVASGAQSNRLELDNALTYLRENDTLVVLKLDRLGRSLRKLIDLINDLQKKNINFISLTENIDTSTPTGQFFFHVTGAFAELERNLIRERTKIGLDAARIRGRKGGRPKAIDVKTFEMAKQLYEQRKTSVKDICDKFGMSKRTFYRYLNG